MSSRHKLTYPPNRGTVFHGVSLEVEVRGGDEGKGPSSLLTVHEAARLLHVHPNTVRHWHKRGLLSAYRVGPRRDRRFRLKDI